LWLIIGGIVAAQLLAFLASAAPRLRHKAPTTGTPHRQANDRLSGDASRRHRAD
jgi:hypothetical protein